jgi:23S rRNA pseudouridine2605 synthase/23S rRNA pseudouridine2604 synthase
VPEVNIIQNKIKIRLQKHLSSAWICSRRKAEEYIKSGLITVNGSVAKIWDKVDPSIDKILLLDKAITQQQNFVYYKLNKPRWIVTTCAQYSEKNIIDIVDIKERVFPIWRLDKDTSWLILLTNDWRLANFLMHPRYNHEKEYLVETYQIISNSQLEKLRNWLMILGSKTKRANINRISNNKFSIIITEWKNRQIRRMLEKVWSRVNKLKRIRIENIQLWNLQIGEYKKLSIEEKNKLFKKLQIN